MKSIVPSPGTSEITMRRGSSRATSGRSSIRCVPTAGLPKKATRVSGMNNPAVRALAAWSTVANNGTFKILSVSSKRFQTVSTLPAQGLDTSPSVVCMTIPFFEGSLEKSLLRRRLSMKTFRMKQGGTSTMLRRLPFPLGGIRRRSGSPRRMPVIRQSRSWRGFWADPRLCRDSRPFHS